MSLGFAIVATAYLRLIFSATVVPLGILANLVAMYIFSQKSLNSRNTKHGYLNAFFCFLNILALTVPIMFSQLLPFFNIVLTNYSSIACKIFSVWDRSILQAPSFHQCLISIFFYTDLRNPTRSKALYRSKNIAKAMILMVIVLIGVNLEYLWFYVLHTYSTVQIFNSSLNHTVNITVKVGSVCTGDILLTEVSDYVNIMCRVFIPFLVLFILSVLIIRQVNRSNRLVISLAYSRRKSELRFGRVLISTNCVFLIFYLPWALSFIISYTLTNNAVRLTSLVNGNNKALLYVYNISLCLAYTFHATPLLVNLAVNKLFKKEFKRLFCSWPPLCLARVLSGVCKCFDKEGAV